MSRRSPPSTADQARQSAKTAEAAQWLALDHQLCFALYSSSLAMTKVYKPLLEPLGLTYPQYLVMLVLWEGDGVTVSQVGDRLKLDSGTLTPLLKRLEAQGLIQRLRDTADERRVLLQLTSTGRAMKSKAVAVPQAISCAVACEIDEISALVRQLAQLRERLLSVSPAPVFPPRSAA